MALSRAFLKLYKFLFPFGDFLWILQKEEYSLSRYRFWLRRFFLRRNFVVSESLVLTQRVRLIGLLAIVLWLIATAALAVYLQTFFLILGVVVVQLLLIPLYVGLAAFLSVPLFKYAHARLQERAVRVIKGLPHIRIVVVAGSYGKTTTKHFLYDLVRYSYKTQMIPGNINTPAGIAEWIISSLAPSTQLLIAEVDAYMEGEIAQSTRMIPPHIAIVTNVGDQHMARFKHTSALASALAEIDTYAQKSASLIVDHTTATALSTLIQNMDVQIVDTTKHIYKGQTLEVHDLSSSNRENLARVLAAVEILDIPVEYVHDTVRALELPDQRQKPRELFGYQAIDDSYNISFSTASAGITAARVYADSLNKKLVVVTAGIPELGPDEAEKNTELGTFLSAHADMTVILATIFKNEIARGFKSKENYVVYPRLHDFIAEAHGTYPPSEWVLLLQPALPDLYY